MLDTRYLAHVFNNDFLFSYLTNTLTKKMKNKLFVSLILLFILLFLSMMSVNVSDTIGSDKTITSHDSVTDPDQVTEPEPEPDPVTEPEPDPVTDTTIRLPTGLPKDREYLFNILSSIYNKPYRPPGYNDSMSWAKNAYIDQGSFEKYAKMAHVYTTSREPDIIIKRMITEREPVNIGVDVIVVKK